MRDQRKSRLPGRFDGPPQREWVSSVRFPRTQLEVATACRSASVSGTSRSSAELSTRTAPGHRALRDRLPAGRRSAHRGAAPFAMHEPGVQFAVLRSVPGCLPTTPSSLWL